MGDFLKKLYNAGVAFFAAVAVICISVTTTLLMRPLYYLDIEILKIPETSGVSKEICRLTYDVLIKYNLLGGPEELIFPTIPMSDTGRIHFEEVKDIFIAMQLISILAIAALIIWYILYKKKKIKNLWWMRGAGLLTFAVAAAVGVALIIDWETAFVIMHKLFFRNDYWIFNVYTDPVIKILPETFFFHCGLMIVVVTLVQILILEITYRRLKNGRTKL